MSLQHLLLTISTQRPRVGSIHRRLVANYGSPVSISAGESALGVDDHEDPVRGRVTRGHVGGRRADHVPVPGRLKRRASSQHAPDWQSVGPSSFFKIPNHAQCVAEAGYQAYQAGQTPDREQSTLGSCQKQVEICCTGIMPVSRQDHYCTDSNQ